MTLEFPHTKLVTPRLYGAGFVHRSTVMLEQKRVFSKLVGRAQRSTMSLYDIVLRVPCNGGI